MDLPVSLLGRRRLLRLVAAGASALAPRGVGAGRGWCRVDPVVRVDGQTCHFNVAAWVSTLPEARDLSTGPIRVRVAVPPGTDFEWIADDNGFGYDYKWGWMEDPELPSGVLELRVYVPMTDGTVPIRAEYNALGNGPHSEAVARGTSNAWLVFRTKAGDPKSPPKPYDPDCRGNRGRCRPGGPKRRPRRS